MTDFRALCARMADELDHYRQLLMDDRRATHALAAEARAALALAQPEPQGFTPDHVNLMCFAFEREPWATWLRRGGCLESAHCELSDLMLAVLARWGRPAIEPVAQPEMVNCHWDGPPPVPHTSVSDWFNEEGSKGILRGLRISPLPSRGGSRQGRRVGGKQ
jgi:hypothetical protein